MNLLFPFSSSQTGASLTRTWRVGVLLLLTGTAQAQAPTVTSLSPARNARSAPRTTDVAVGFSQALSSNAATLGALKVFSQQAGGKKAGTATVSGNTLSFNPSTDFKPGETVFATITAAAQSASGAAATPHVFQFTAATSPSTGSFGNGSEVSISGSIFGSGSGLATGDIDRDGDADLLATNATANLVSVRLNNGSGTFSGTQEVAVGQLPLNVALSDVDSDGDLDMLVANQGLSTNNFTGTVSVRLNDGAGNFSGSQEVPAGRAPYDVVAGDVDGDGDLDLAIPLGTGGVSIRLNDGSGTFSGTQQVPVSFIVYAAVLADLDNDGDLDLAAANYSANDVAIRLNNGNGTFTNGQTVTAGGRPSGLAVGDLDGDGDLDLVADAFLGGTDVRYNDGNGNFSGTQNLAVSTFKLGDVDGDGDLDVVGLGGALNSVATFLNNGLGGFNRNQIVALEEPGAVTISDVDGDGDLDLLARNRGGVSSKSVSVRLNRAAPLQLVAESYLPTRNKTGVVLNTNVAVTFNQAAANNAPTQQALKVFSQQAGGKKPGTGTVTGSTLTFDPTTDFKAGETVFVTLAPSAQSSIGTSLEAPKVFQFTTKTNFSVGRFVGGSEVAVGNPNGTPQSVATGDVDGDGDLDLLTANAGLDKVSVRLNNGSAGFSGSQEVAVGTTPLAIVLGDVDSDGDLDLVTANGTTGAAGTVSVRLNNGSGTFSGTLDLVTGIRLRTAGTGLALGDVDGDGDLDILTSYLRNTSGGNGLVGVRLNMGNGTFSLGQELSTIGASPTKIAVGDVDNDGDLDLLISNGTTISVCFNDGTGNFSSNQELEGSGPIVVGDIDADGDLDFLTFTDGSDLGVRKNNGLGVFSYGQKVTTTGGLTDLALADLDGDNNPDVVAVSSNTNSAIVYLNNSNSTATFRTNQTLAVGLAPAGVALGDLDGDGTLDLLTANSASQNVSVRLNKTVLANAPAQLTEQVSLYPNPAHTSVRLLLPAELAKQRLQIRVMNSLGQVVLTQTLAAQATPELVLPNLAAGLYSLQLQTSQGVVAKRLVLE